MRLALVCGLWLTALALPGLAQEAAPTIPEPGRLEADAALPAADAAPLEENAAPPAADPLYDDSFFDDPLYDEALDAESEDPLEPVNRVFFEVNERVYAYVLDPVAAIYALGVPRPVRVAVRRFFGNLEEPSMLVNRLLRGQGRAAGSTGARFVVNSTVGLAGLFDPAARIGLPRAPADFGETLAVYGVGDGAYFVVPLVGPSNLRDTFGGLVDAAMRPDTWLLAVGPQVFVGAGGGIARYEGQRLHLEELRKSSLDFYAALRSAWRMHREAQVAEARTEVWGEEPTAPDPELWAIPRPVRIVTGAR